MKRYTVVIAASAERDIAESFIWGVQEWGLAPAQQWVRELRANAVSILGKFPLSHPLAPESEESPIEIRQLIVGRYRLLFCVDGRKVYILHLRGAFVNDG